MLKAQREKAAALQDAERSAQILADTEEQLRQQAHELAEQMAEVCLPALHLCMTGVGNLRWAV